MQRGFTLIEILAVMFILGVIASVTLPDLSGSKSHKLDRATEELAMALRFARDESVRTGEPHAFSVNGSDGNIGGKTIKIYKINLASPEDATAAVYHPVSKQPFDYNFVQQLGGARITSLIASFVYNRTANYSTNKVYFDKEGKPFHFSGTIVNEVVTGGVYRLYFSGKIDLELNGQTKSVKLETGGQVLIL